ncbi:MAG TPA: type II toxin-antitoxin system ParD family antitoxin [Microvirga sp.]|jgi:putative addiction module CopG family antidote|nr:type II toxin-antitoxin system ParD family antitoxin [Microvirga sp.]
MPSKSALSVSLTPELSRFIAHTVATGRYRSSSEVVREALRLLERKVERDPQGKTTIPGFLQGGGETGALMRARDWTSSPLGDPSQWPRSLGALLEVVLGSDQPMSIVWGPSRTLLYNDRYADILMHKHPAALGQPLPEVWPEIWPDVGPLIARAFAGEAINVDEMSLVLHRTQTPEEAHFAFSYTPVRGGTGAVLGVFCPCREITKAVSVSASLTAANKHLGRLFQQAPGFMCVLQGPEHVFEIINDSYLQLVGHRRDIVGKPVREALPEVEGQGFFELLDGVLATGEPFRGQAMPVALQRQPGSPVEQRFVDLIYQPIGNDNGTTTGIFVEGYDVTERVTAEEQQKLLVRELSHRVKNLFAVASGMVSISARSARTPDEMAKTLRGRLDALARANDLVHRRVSDAWGGAQASTTMETLIRTVLLPYEDPERAQGRECITLNGPAVPVGGNAITSLALVLHEITTNSAKHGALSTPKGRVRVDWTLSEADLHMGWKELDGPTVDEPPKATGFGTILTQRSVVGQLQGKIEYDWRREGLAVHLTIPLEQLQR